MSYLKLILKNPFRNKARTSLAIIGIAIGIATIVALGMVTAGLKTSTENTLKAGEAEITVVQSGSNEGSTGSISESRVADIKNLSGVKDATGILKITVNLNGSSSPSSGSGLSPGPNNGFSLSGIDSSKLSLIGIDSVNGSFFTNGSSNEIIIGKTAAENYNKKVGDTITVYGRELKITGIFETGNIMQDSGAFMSLNTLQNLTNNTGEVSGILVKVSNDANVTKESQLIENTYPDELSTTTAADQAKRMNTALNTVDTASWAISILAIFIGGIGVINTMIMAVFERTREIGVLKAVGWKSRRILGMILGESIVITLLAAVIGTVIGVIGVEVLLSVTSMFGEMMSPILTIDTLLRAFGVAFLVGVVGGLYPAYRASRLAPTEALRYE